MSDGSPALPTFQAEDIAHSKREIHVYSIYPIGYEYYQIYKIRIPVKQRYSEGCTGPSR